MEHLDHPYPNFTDAKMGHFFSFVPSSMLWGGGGEGEKIFLFFFAKGMGGPPLN